MQRNPIQYAFLMTFIMTGGCSAACMSAGIYDIITQTDNMSGAIMMTVIFAATFLISIIAGGVSIKRPSSSITEHDEKLALALAKQKGGLVSVAELALNSSMDVTRSRELLDHFVTTGVAEPDVNSSGEILYRFSAFTAEGGVSFDFDRELAEAEREAAAHQQQQKY